MKGIPNCFFFHSNDVYRKFIVQIVLEQKQAFIEICAILN